MWVAWSLFEMATQVPCGKNPESLCSKKSEEDKEEEKETRWTNEAAGCLHLDLVREMFRKELTAARGSDL